MDTKSPSINFVIISVGYSVKDTILVLSQFSSSLILCVYAHKALSGIGKYLHGYLFSKQQLCKCPMKKDLHGHARLAATNCYHFCENCQLNFNL